MSGGNPAINVSMRKLRALQAVCGGGTKRMEAPPDVDLSKMTPYQRAQYNVAERMRVMRTLMTELDELPTGGNPTRRVELTNQVRKEERKLTQEMKDARLLAVGEKRQSDYDVLQQHYKTTQQLWKSRSGTSRVTDDEVGGVPGYGAAANTRGSSGIELENALPSAGGYSIRQDEEFLQFFQQTQQNDVLIDKALDRLQLGVQRLQDNATALNQELKVQSVLIDETEIKLDKVTGRLKGVNRKLKDTVNAVDKDRMCLYVFCLIIVIGLAGGIYFAVSGNS